MGPGGTLRLVSDYTLAELASRAGLQPADVGRLIDLGVLAAQGGDDRFRASDVRRIQIVQALEEAGLPMPALGEALRRGDLSLDFVEQPSYDRFASLASVTFRELSAQTTIPIELLVVVREAMGFAHPEPDDRVRESELEVVPFIEILLRAGIKPDLITRALRVYGDAVRRIAETEAGWWRTEILLPMFQAGKRGREIGDLTAAFAGEFGPINDVAILALYHGQQTNAWMRNIFEGFETVLSETGLHDRQDRDPAISFLDLTGYTRLTEERGDDAAADVSGRLATLVQRSATQHTGKAVKWLGDGVMFHFRDPAEAVEASLEMIDAARVAGLPPAHVGVHVGPVLFQEGDYFGRTVNAAARISDYARQGEVLVSQEVVDASAGNGSVAFTEIGPVELKGLAGALRLHVARRAG
jgi:class 3 adenylate cyclase